MKAYLDNAASTQMDQRVIDRMMEAAALFGNPSSIHSSGRAVKAQIEKARKNIAKLIGAQASEIYFTSGATEANNLAIYSACANSNIKTIVTSQLEHPSVLETCKHAARKYKKELKFLEHNQYGEFNIDELRAFLKEGNVFVSLMHGNNEIGNLNPIEEIGQICQEHSAIFHCDTVQTIGHQKINVVRNNIDFLVCSAHKIHGPKGVGFLYAKKGAGLQSIMLGGGQERGIRPGTENYMGIIALEEALILAKGDHQIQQEQHISSLKEHALQMLREKVPGFKVNGSGKKSLSTILNIELPTKKSLDLLLFDLDLRGVGVSGGSACSSGSIKGSSVLAQLQANRTAPSVRLSFSRFTSLDEVGFAVEAIADILRQ